MKFCCGATCIISVYRVLTSSTLLAVFAGVSIQVSVCMSPQMAGFVCMLWGSITYYGILKYKGLAYPAPAVNHLPPEYQLVEET